MVTRARTEMSVSSPNRDAIWAKSHKVIEADADKSKLPYNPIHYSGGPFTISLHFDMQATHSPSDPDGLEAYFTDVEDLRAYFRQAVEASKLSKRLLIIHGVGGIGKSSLLRMFRLHCKKAQIPVGLVSGDEAKSAVDILSGWADDLKADKVALPSFIKTLAQYRIIQAKVEDQTRKAQETRGKAFQSIGKAAAKTVVEIATGYIPVVGPIVSALGSTSVEAFVDWLGSFLTKPEINLLLDPSKKITNDFIDDIGRAATKQRLVLMLDTFEQMTALDDWTCNLAQPVSPNIFLVIAGRAMPNWSRTWPGWLAQAQVEELKPMTKRVMRELIQRYYMTQRGGAPNRKQVDAIIQFARGLPIVVTSAVQLWVRYGVEDFQTVKPQVIADLVDRLLEGVPPDFRPVLETVATLRWFNRDVLRARLKSDDANSAYDELRRFPFIRPRVEGLALHDAMREMLDENLRVHDPRRYQELHQQAGEYFEEQLGGASGEESERLGLEKLYHQVCANEADGIWAFRKTAEELTRYRLLNRLRILVNDANGYLLREIKNQLWRDYYSARLAHLEDQFEFAEKAYRAIASHEHSEPLLRAYALCDLGHLLRRLERKADLEAIQVYEQALGQVDDLDPKLAAGLLDLSGAYRRRDRWDEALNALERARVFFEEFGDTYDLALAYKRIKDHFFNQGRWSEAYRMRQQGLRLVEPLTEQSYLKAELLRGLAVGWYLAGDYAGSEQTLRTALKITDKLGSTESANILRNLGIALGLEGRYSEATECFERSAAICESRADLTGLMPIRGARGFILTRQGDLAQAYDYLTKCLDTHRGWQDKWGLPRYLKWRGMLFEIKHEHAAAIKDYEECAAICRPERRYQLATALVGMIRLQHAQAKLDDVTQIFTEAQAVSLQHEYNDHLTSLRLTQGHIAWDSQLPEWGQGFDAALHYYQHALIYALRYNRFMLDVALWGGGICTPLRPIVPHCLERGDEGRRMLAALCDWWQIGVNDVGIPRPDTISPIPEGVPLIEAERLARQREPGDGSPQTTVIEKLNATLAQGA